jgi:hypothetical protein
MHRRARPPKKKSTDPDDASVVDALLSQSDPLDEAEQEAVVQGLRQQADAQQRRTASALAALSAALSLLFVYCALEQARRPYQQRHTGELRTVLEEPFFAWAPAGLVLAAQALALAAQAAAMVAEASAGQKQQQPPLTRPPLLRLAAALPLAALGSAYWLAAMLAHARKHPALGAPWELGWLPLAPLLVAGACGAARRAARATRREVEALAAARYAHKRV